MKVISDHAATAYAKRVQPFIIFGAFALFGYSRHEDHRVLLWALLLLTVALVFLFFRKSVWSLADAVEDNGDHLLVKRGHDAQQLVLADVSNVKSAFTFNPKGATILTLCLRQKGPLGSNISFIPDISSGNSSRALADALNRRIHGQGSPHTEAATIPRTTAG